MSLNAITDRTEKTKTAISSLITEKINRLASQVCTRLVSRLSGSENICFSPLSYYLALVPLAIGTTGKAKRQLLDALGVSDDDELTADCALITEHIAKQNGAAEDNTDDDEEALTSRKRFRENFSYLNIMTGIWANTADGYSISDEYLSRLSDISNTGDDITCHASDFHNEWEMTNEIREWAGKGTDGFLLPDIYVDPESMVILANLLYFKGIWSEEFDPHRTENDIFHAPDGDVTVSFMFQRDFDGWGRDFGDFLMAVRYLGRRAMVFFLPKDGFEIFNIFSSPYRTFRLFNTEMQDRSDVIWSVPKFDVSYALDLIPTSRSIGIDEVFRPSAAFKDILNGLDSDKTSLSKFEQQTRLAIDEKGCEAATLSISHWACFGCATEYPTLEMELNRPFAFAVFERLPDRENEDKEYSSCKWLQMPLFFGVVNNPSY